MIVRSGMFIKSLMNTRTKKRYRDLFPVSFFDMEGLEGRVVNDSPADCQSAQAGKSCHPHQNGKDSKVLAVSLFYANLLDF